MIYSCSIKTNRHDHRYRDIPICKHGRPFKLFEIVRSRGGEIMGWFAECKKCKLEFFAGTKEDLYAKVNKYINDRRMICKRCGAKATSVGIPECWSNKGHFAAHKMILPD